MKNKWSKVPALLAIIAGALIIIAPISFARPCQDLLELKAGGLVAMKCFWTSHIFVLLGALVVLTGILQAWSNNQESQRLLGIILIALTAGLLLIPRPFVIGTCSMNMGACHHMVSVVNIFSLLVLLAGLVSILIPSKVATDTNKNAAEL